MGKSKRADDGLANPMPARKRRIYTKQATKARTYVHFFEPVYGKSLQCVCGLSESNPIHDFRSPPGVGPI